MRVLIFDVKGPYGHFRKPYAPMSPVTYPFPPPPTVLGMIGAILGLSKEEYHEKLAWDKVHIGVALRRPTQIFRTSINLLNTKDNKYFRPRGENTHIQVPYEFLKDPAYRIYAANLPEVQFDLLVELLARQETVYTPTLGLAQCLGEVAYVSEVTASEPKNGTHLTQCAVAINETMRVDYETGRRYQRIRIPAVMDGERRVHRYQEVIAAEDGKPISVTGAEVFEVGGEAVTFL